MEDLLTNIVIDEAKLNKYSDHIARLKNLFDSFDKEHGSANLEIEGLMSNGLYDEAERVHHEAHINLEIFKDYLETVIDNWSESLER